MRFAMHFVESPRAYLLENSADFPDAESLTIILLQLQIHGLVFRAADDVDWHMITYQRWDNVVTPPPFRIRLKEVAQAPCAANAALMSAVQAPRAAG